MKDTVKYWVDLSDYDLVTAEAMLETKRYLYVGYMCHQSIEKILKAYYTHKQQNTAPLTHSLSYLAKKAEIYDDFSDSQKDFIDQIEPLNIEARYPSQKERLLRSLTERKCIELINTTKDLQRWIKNML